MRGVRKILLEIPCCWRRERNVSFLCRSVQLNAEGKF